MDASGMNFDDRYPAETPWQAVGRYVRLRRERLGLKQEDLKERRGPGVSTVGKIERATQDSFPLRTQHALENALGWSRGTVEDIVHAASDPDGWFFFHADLREDFERRLIDDDIPDMSSPALATSAAELTDEELLTELTFRMRRYALAAAEMAEGGDGDADEDAGGSAPTTPARPKRSDFSLAAHEEDQPIDDEQRGGQE